ncbi:hypothetical protein F5Y07DRAFT_176409 [Xylaria sp. FL0933]|nr:hypothetical protein F5Y07DRAFT_176409 [Xylaria sp. FL0933]
MRHITFRDATAIVQLIFYMIYLAAGVFLCYKHGWRRGGGWFIIVVFSFLRIIGALFEIVAISYPARSVYAGVLVIESIGIAPLIGISAGMLARLNKYLYRPIRRVVFSLRLATGLAGIVVASVSASVPTPLNSPSPFVANHLTKAASVIFAAELIVTELMLLAMIIHHTPIPRVGMCLLYSVAACSPFVAARIIYGLLFAFSSDPRFNILVGSTLIYFFLSVLPQLIAVGISIIAGFHLPKTPKLWAPRRMDESMALKLFLLNLPFIIGILPLLLYAIISIMIFELPIA